MVWGFLLSFSLPTSPSFFLLLLSFVFHLTPVFSFFLPVPFLAFVFYGVVIGLGPRYSALNTTNTKKLHPRGGETLQSVVGRAPPWVHVTSETNWRAHEDTEEPYAVAKTGGFGRATLASIYQADACRIAHLSP